MIAYLKIVTFRLMRMLLAVILETPAIQRAVAGAFAGSCGALAGAVTGAAYGMIGGVVSGGGGVAHELGCN